MEMRDLKLPYLLLIALAACALPTRGFASVPVNYCVSLDDLAHKVKTCSANVLYAKAAQICVEKLERDIDAQKAMLALAMGLTSQHTADAQGARIENNSRNLADLRAGIETLEGYAAHARAEVVNYSENFLYAGKISKPMAAKLGIEKTLRKFHCFSSNRAALGQVVGILDGRLAEFKKLKGSALAMEAKDTANLKKLDSGSLTSAVSNRAPAATGAPRLASPPPVAKKGPSSITGTEKIGESERALQKLQK
jgi:hypothetical protein